jgi:NifU-like protein
MGDSETALQFALYWLVDESDGIIADAKFQAFGPPALLAALDATCELLLRKTYDQASRLSADLIACQIPTFAPQQAPLLNKILDVIDLAVEQCLDIPFASSYQNTPLESDSDNATETTEIPGWENFPPKEKLALIEEILAKEIRPYIELDAGGIKVLGMGDQGEVRISYEGACTSCPSSTGSTLNAIQRILRSRIHPDLLVVPEIK